jgi:hypothetical protein
VKAKKPIPDAVEELFLSAWSRPPKSGGEAEKAAELVGNAPSVREGLQDLLWALVNSREFQFVR